MDRSAKAWMVVAVVLFVVIIALTYLLITIPSVQTGAIATTTPEVPGTKTPEPVKPDPNAPLSARVTVSSPKAHTSVGASFEVKGSAPGNWFFEADFPLQVRDKDGNVIARTFASAQGDWMTTELVGFTSTIHLNVDYKGPATLILLKNNPSGMPEHDDAVEIPIIIE